MFTNIVRVNLRDYKVIIVPKIGNGEAVGLCDYSKREILIEHSSSMYEMESTYHHELGHAVAHEYGPILSQMDKHEQYAELVRIAFDCMFEACIALEDLVEEFENEIESEETGGDTDGHHKIDDRKL